MFEGVMGNTTDPGNALSLTREAPVAQLSTVTRDVSRPTVQMDVPTIIPRTKPLQSVHFQRFFLCVRR